MKARASRLQACGTTFDARSSSGARNDSATRRKSRWHCWNASSSPAATPTTSCSTPSAAAARRWSRRENLGRQWIGIDISPTACRVMAKRLRDVCHIAEDEKLWRVGRGFVVRDLPWTEEKLRKLPPFEFENWAVIALGGIPNKAQVGDMGIDGRIYPVSRHARSGQAGGRTRLHGRLVSRSRSSRRTRPAARTSTRSRPS